MTNNNVHERVIVWLAGLLGIPFIKDRQSMDAPAIPYGIVDLIDWEELREHNTELVWEELTTENEVGILELKATPITPMRWTFSITVYGTDSGAYVRRIQAARHLAQMQEPLLPDIHVNMVGHANSIPELIDEVWQERTQVNLLVDGWSNYGFVVDTVEDSNFDYTREQ